MAFTRLLPIIRRCALAAAAAMMVTAAGGAEHPEIAKRRAAEQKTFTDAQITEGFLKLTLASELQLTGRSDRIRKFEVPVQVFIDNKGKPDRSKQVAAVVADIQRRIQHIDLSVVKSRKDANLTVTLVRDRELGRTIRARFGRERGRSILKTLDPQCLSSFRRDTDFRIVSADVILVSDAGDFVFYDCAYEEILQSLGPINDDPTVPWSMFNDQNHFGFFGLYDQYILNLLYHPRMRAGMTRAEAEALLPSVLPEVRAFVAKTNDLPKP